MTYPKIKTSSLNRDIASKVNEFVSVNDFGPAGSGDNLDATYFQNAINYCTTNNKRLYVPAGTYVIKTALSKAQSFIGVNMFGDGVGNTILDFSQIASGAGLTIVGGSGALPMAIIEGMTLKGNNNLRLVEICGQCSQILRDVKFSTALVGLRFHNRDAGSFTEFCVADNCRFDDDCWLAVEYIVTSGNDSFHGSGLRNNCIVGSTNTQVARIRINSGAHPYNAPMDATFFMNGSIPIIEHLEASRSSQFYGNIKIEAFTGTPTIVSGYDCGLNGGVSFLGNPPTWGKLVLTPYQSSDGSGILQHLNGMYVSPTIAINTAGYTTVPIPTGMRGSRLFFVQAYGDQVEVSYLLFSMQSAFAFYPAPQIIGKQVGIDGGMSGVDLSFIQSAGGKELQIRQMSGPATNVVVKVTAYNMGAGASTYTSV